MGGSSVRWRLRAVRQHPVSNVFEHTAYSLLRYRPMVSRKPGLAQAHTGKINRARNNHQRQQSGVVVGNVAADGEDQGHASQPMRGHAEKRHDHAGTAGYAQAGQVFERRTCAALPAKLTF